jgi:hypothetical protein
MPIAALSVKAQISLQGMESTIAERRARNHHLGETLNDTVSNDAAKPHYIK